MAYNSKHTGAEVEALLDRAAGAALTYDISPLVAKLVGEFDGYRTADLTAEEYEAAKAAYDEGRIFLLPGGAAKPTFRQTFDNMFGDSDFVEFTIATQLNMEGYFDDTAFGVPVGTLSYSISKHLSPGDNSCTYRLSEVLRKAIPADALPTKLSQLTNDCGFVAPREVVKTNESTIGYGTSYSSTTPSVTLAADKFHIVGRVAGLSIALPDGSDTDGREYVCQFFVPNSTYTLTLPDSVSWLGGNVPAFEGNTCCMLSIVNHCAVIGVFKQS